VNGQVADHLGRKSLMGNAYLPDPRSRTAVNRGWMSRSRDRRNPGSLFRAFTQQDYEQVYIRRTGAVSIRSGPVRAKVKGIASWQLCNGPGSTAMAEFPAGMDALRLR